MRTVSNFRASLPWWKTVTPEIVEKPSITFCYILKMSDSYITNLVCPCWFWLESELVTLPNVNSREDVYSSLIEAALVPGGQATADVSTNCQEVRKVKRLINYKSPLFTLMVLLNDQKWPNSGHIWAKFELLDLSSTLDCLTFIQNLQYEKKYFYLQTSLYNQYGCCC